jgi:hypothetical protein
MSTKPQRGRPKGLLALVAVLALGACGKSGFNSEGLDAWEGGETAVGEALSGWNGDVDTFGHKVTPFLLPPNVPFIPDISFRFGIIKLKVGETYVGHYEPYSDGKRDYIEGGLLVAILPHPFKNLDITSLGLNGAPSLIGLMNAGILQKFSETEVYVTPNLKLDQNIRRKVQAITQADFDKIWTILQGGGDVTLVLDHHIYFRGGSRVVPLEHISYFVVNPNKRAEEDYQLSIVNLSDHPDLADEARLLQRHVYPDAYNLGDHTLPP